MTTSKSDCSDLPGFAGDRSTAGRVSNPFVGLAALLMAGVWCCSTAGYSQPAGGIYSLGISVDGKVRFKWKPNAEGDLAGYRLYVGTAPGIYSGAIDVGMVPRYELTNLVQGMTYYFALTAYNGEGRESDFTPELTYQVPVAVISNAPPTLDAISDMTLPEDSGPYWVGLTGISPGNSNEMQTLSVSATSSNPDLIPDPIVDYSNLDSAGSLSMQPFANSFGTAVITVTVDDGQMENSRVSQSFLVVVDAVNDPPQISAIPSQTLLEDKKSGSIAFTITDLETAASSLVVNSFSSNPSLIGPGEIAVNGSGSDRTVSLRPLRNQFGTAEITLRVSDPEGAVAESRFTLEVLPVNDSPYFEPTADLVLEEGPTAHSVLLAGIHSGAANENDPLTITATSDETNLISIVEVFYAAPDATPLLVLNPVPNATGTATITTTINDGQSESNTFSRTFAVTIVNTPPTISTIPDQLIPRNRVSDPIPFTISDAGRPAADLVVTATSSNPLVVPLSGVILMGFDNERALMIEPVNGRAGVSILTLTVSDGSASTSVSFQVTVDAL